MSQDFPLPVGLDPWNDGCLLLFPLSSADVEDRSVREHRVVLLGRRTFPHLGGAGDAPRGVELAVYPFKKLKDGTGLLSQRRERGWPRRAPGKYGAGERRV